MATMRCIIRALCASLPEPASCTTPPSALVQTRIIPPRSLRLTSFQKKSCARRVSTGSGFGVRWNQIPASFNTTPGREQAHALTLDGWASRSYRVGAGLAPALETRTPVLKFAPMGAYPCSRPGNNSWLLGFLRHLNAVPPRHYQRRRRRGSQHHKLLSGRQIIRPHLATAIGIGRHHYQRVTVRREGYI